MQQTVLDLQTQQNDLMNNPANNVTRGGVRANPVNKLMHLRDEPQFSGQVYEDPIDFLARFDMVGKVHYWTDVDQISIFCWHSRKILEVATGKPTLDRLKRPLELRFSWT